MKATSLYHHNQVNNFERVKLEKLNAEATFLKDLYSPIQPSNLPIMSNHEGHSFIRIKQLIRVQAYGNYFHLPLKNRTVDGIKKTLKWIGSKLQRNHFIRNHTSHIIEAENIRQFSTLGLHLRKSI